MGQLGNDDHRVKQQNGRDLPEIKHSVRGTEPSRCTDIGDLRYNSKQQQKKINQCEIQKSALTVALGMSASVMLLVACLGRGLYFPVDVYGVILVASGSFLIGGVMLLLLFVMQHRKNNTKNILSSGGNEQTNLQFQQMNHVRWVIWPMAMMVCFGLHIWSGSVSTQGSLDEMLRWSLLAMFALLAGILALRVHGVRWFAFGWHAAGGLVVLSGLLAVCGVLPLPFGVMRTADSEISSAGARLGGLLQYPNAYGAAAGMYALERLAAVARAMARPVPAWQLIAAALPLMPAQVALLLSESRGAWLATGIAVACAFAWQRREDRLPLLLAMAAPLASAAWLYRQLAAAQLAPAPLPGLLALAGAWAAALLGTLLLCRLLHSGARASAAALTAMALAVAAAATLAVASTAERLAAGVGTGLSRLHMWRDALGLWAEAVWFGHGGDTWRTMFRAIQSSPYVGGEVHSGLIDVALDTGLIGLMIISAWFAFTLIRTMEHAPVLVPAMLVFILHGAVDFDWSFTLMWMLFIWVGAWAYAYKNEKLIGAAEEHIMVKAKQASAAYASGHSIQRSRLPVWFRYPSMWAMPTLTGLAILVWLGGTAWLAGHSVMAEVKYRLVKYIPEGSDPYKAGLMAAFQSNAYRPDIALSLSRTLKAKDAEALLLDSLSHSPAEPRLYQELGKLAAQAGRGAQAGTYFEQAIALNRYDTQTQSAALYWMVHASRREWAAGYTERAKQTAATGVRMYEHYEKLIEKMAAESIRNDRRFILDKNASNYGSSLRILASASIPLKEIRRTP